MSATSATNSGRATRCPPYRSFSTKMRRGTTSTSRLSRPLWRPSKQPLLLPLPEQARSRQCWYASISITLDVYSHLYASDHRPYLQSPGCASQKPLRDPCSDPESEPQAHPTIEACARAND